MENASFQPMLFLTRVSQSWGGLCNQLGLVVVKLKGSHNECEAFAAMKFSLAASANTIVPIAYIIRDYDNSWTQIAFRLKDIYKRILKRASAKLLRGKSYRLISGCGVLHIYGYHQKEIKPERSHWLCHFHIGFGDMVLVPGVIGIDNLNKCIVGQVQLKPLALSEDLNHPTLEVAIAEGRESGGPT